MPEDRYDGKADWYESVMRDPNQHLPLSASTRELLIALLDRGSGLVLDIGCGTGLMASEVRSLGYEPVGLDISADQLHYARRAMPVIHADAAARPVPNESIGIAFSTFVWSDLDEFSTAIAETYRILRHRGRYVALGVHPCFYGSHSESRGNEVIVHPGYRDTGFLSTSKFGSTIREQVGAWHRSLETLINEFLAIGFNIARVAEGGPKSIPTILGLDLRKGP